MSIRLGIYWITNIQIAIIYHSSLNVNRIGIFYCLDLRSANHKIISKDCFISNYNETQYIKFSMPKASNQIQSYDGYNYSFFSYYGIYLLITGFRKYFE